MQDAFRAYPTIVKVGRPMSVQQTEAKFKYKPDKRAKVLVFLGKAQRPSALDLELPEIDKRSPHGYFSGDGGRMKRGSVSEIEKGDRFYWTGSDLQRNTEIILIYEPCASSIPYQHVLEQMPPSIMKIVERSMAIRRLAGQTPFGSNLHGFGVERFHANPDDVSKTVIQGLPHQNEVAYKLNYEGRPEGILFGEDTAHLFREGMSNLMLLLNYVNHLMAVRKYEEEHLEEVLRLIDEITNDPSITKVRGGSRLRFSIVVDRLSELAARKATLKCSLKQ
jgi:hypothetical protein